MEENIIDEYTDKELVSTCLREEYHYDRLNKATLKKNIYRIFQIATLSLGLASSIFANAAAKDINHLSQSKSILKLHKYLVDERLIDSDIKNLLSKKDYTAIQGMSVEEKDVYFDSKIALAKKLLAINGAVMILSGGAFYIASNKKEKFSTEEAKAIYDLAYDENISQEVRDIVKSGMLMSGEDWITVFNLGDNYQRESKINNRNLAFLDEIDLENEENNFETPAKTYAYNIYKSYSIGRKYGFLEGYFAGFKESHKVNVLNKGLGEFYKIDEEDYRKNNDLDNVKVELDGDLLLSYEEGYEDGFSEAYSIGYDDFLTNLSKIQEEEELEM